jgi:hypothetical protein
MGRTYNMGTHCRQELNGGSLPLFQKFFLLYRVLELQDREVQFDGCLFSVKAFGKILVFANFATALPVFLSKADW